MENNRVGIRLRVLYQGRKENEVKLIYAIRYRTGEIINECVSNLKDYAVRISEIEALSTYNDIMELRKEMNVDNLNLE